ncbi:dihydrolipoyl dehydrogenase [Rhodococcus sp. P1Y]|uniref:dihydrolipoyl dehydrogenase n=1 Tax=Rhodococcus sp. P1Y TaxID=1302308 RepID=UPI000EB541E5|nr:dihydrolipoyl dehydrogenase [Rhodococcus sp. P1Y]AYJ52077.1 dihydrolipoyl dehydrogenase [Rhodococcus sp. P1Y]
MTAATYDVVVVGGGSGGYAAALRSAQLGLSVALIERDKLGGTCLHAGCIPTKALLHVAEVADSISHSAAVGIMSTLDKIDAQAVQTFKNGVVDRLHRGLQGLVDASDGITYIRGEAVLVDSHTVAVDGEHLTGRHLVLATGSTPRMIPGVDRGGRILTSEDALALAEIPASVVIIGGSVIGVEFASAWKSLGVQVTVVEALANLVPLEDASLSRQLERAFKKRRIDVRKNASVTDIAQSDDGVTVTLADRTQLVADYVLVAVGRGPRTEGIGLKEAGVDTDGGWITTDERLRTSVEDVYAIGDVVRGLQLAHRSFAHGIFVAEDIAGLSPAPVRDSALPRVTYSEPELASVGLSELEARATYGEGIKTYEYNLAGNGKSQILQTAGIVKMIEDSNGVVVGVHMVGSRMSEQIGEAGLIVNLGLTSYSIAHMIHAHPTQNEAIGEALLALAGQPLHAHG